MQEDINREVLEELKKINQKLDALGEQRGLSTPLKIIAVIVGFALVGPLLLWILSIISKTIN